MEPFQALSANDGMLYIRSWMEKDPHVVAGFTTRRGGCSEPPFHGLNCALHVGDDPEKVRKNRETVCRRAGFPFEGWTCAEQVHGSKIREVTREERGAGRLGQGEAIAGTDGLYTRERGIFLTSFYADCVPLYFYDPLRRIVGIAHAGWRGTVAGIGPRMVQEWWERFGSRPEQIRVAIGPSIAGCCYEVDALVADPVRRFVPGWQEVLIPKENGKYMLDLRKANGNLLQKAGIRQEHIEISTYCTSCRNDLFFSYRKEKGRTGRMAAFVALR
ncbi:peptidoglycan editing factor PgeF [Bacillaceae bacterium]